MGFVLDFVMALSTEHGMESKKARETELEREKMWGVRYLSFASSRINRGPSVLACVCQRGMVSP